MSVAGFAASEVLFCDESGGRMAAGTIRNRLRHLMNVEGRPQSEWFSPHGLRRACATGGRPVRGGYVHFLAIRRRWGGHGFVDTGRRRRLRYADARAAELGDLDLDSLLTTFASDLVPGLNQQVWLVDACQVHESTAFGHETFRHGKPVAGRVQDVLFAAGVGQAAANLRVRRTGVFSREVLRVLESAERIALKAVG